MTEQTGRAPELDGLAGDVFARMFPEATAEALDPAGWIVDRLGEHLWSKQREIAAAVREHRHVGVQAAHGVGKSYLGARLVAWWLAVHPVGSAFAVTTAPTSNQVEGILWREIGRAHRKGELAGRITSGSVPTWRMGDELVAWGRKPQDLTDPEQAAAAFQGIHARHVLVVLDEATGIPPWLWDAAESLMTNDRARLLAIGNPTDPSSRFAEVCAPGSGWHVVKVSAFDTPAFTGERVPSSLLEDLTSRTWVEERRKRWGEESPAFVARVLGEFPEVSEDALVAPSWIRAAQERDLSGRGSVSAGRLGVDVARSGSDETVIYRVRAGVARLEHRAQGHDLMRTTGVVVRLLLDVGHGLDAVVDVIGLGAGVFDRLRELGHAVSAFNAAERAHRPDRFRRRRDEAYWALREAFREGEVDLDPADEDLAAQLGAIRWSLNSSGQVVIESKDDMRRRGISSPDRADALCMAFVGGGWDRPLTKVERYRQRVAAAARPWWAQDMPDWRPGQGLTDGLMERQW